MITTWTIFVITASTFIVLVMVLAFFLMRKLKMSMKAIIPTTLLTGLIGGGASFGYLSATQGSHLVVVKNDLSVEFLYSFGENNYKLSNGSYVTLPKMKNLIINDSGKELSLEEVIYGEAYRAPESIIIEKDNVFQSPIEPKLIYYFSERPPESVTTENYSENVYWLGEYSGSVETVSDTTEITTEEVIETDTNSTK